MALELEGDFELLSEDSASAFVEFYRRLFFKEEYQKLASIVSSFKIGRLLQHTITLLPRQSDLCEHLKITATLQSPFNESSENFYFHVKCLDFACKSSTNADVAINAFHREHFFYNVLLKGYKNLKLDVSFSPRLFFSEASVIYMDDISFRGFKNLPKKECFDLNHCKVSLKSLAKFHSNGIVYERDYIRDKGHDFGMVFPHQFKEHLSRVEEDDSSRLWFKFPLKRIIEVFADLDIKVEENFTNRLSEVVSLGNYKLKKLKNSYHNTILHGDLWSNNILFSYERDIPDSCIFVDYQLIKYGPPAIDVLNLIYSNTTHMLRLEHFWELVEYYFTNLNNYLSAQDVVNTIPYDEYIKIIIDLRIFSKFQSVCERCMIYIPDSYVHAESVETPHGDYRGYQFTKKLTGIRSCYSVNDDFRDLIAKDVDELEKLMGNENLFIPEPRE